MSTANMLLKPELNGHLEQPISGEKEDTEKEDNIYNNHNIFSLFTFWYMGEPISLSRQSIKKNIFLKSENIYSFIDKKHMLKLIQHFREEYMKSHSVFKSLKATFGNYKALLMLILIALSSICLISFPLLIYTLLKSFLFFSEPPKNYYNSSSYGYIISLILVVIIIIKTFVDNHITNFLEMLKQKVCITLYGSFVYLFLEIWKSSLDKIPLHNILEIIIQDTKRIAKFVGGLFQILSSILIAIGGFALMYYQISWCTFIAFTIMIIFSILHQLRLSFFFKLKQKINGSKKKRFEFVNELIKEIKEIKFQSLEKYFFNQVVNLRKVEIKNICKSVLLKGLFQSGIKIAPIFLFAFVFSLYQKVIDNITVPQIFMVIVISLIVNHRILYIFKTVKFIKKISISVRRIELFLNFEKRSALSNTDNLLEIKEGDFLWENQSIITNTKEILELINLKIKNHFDNSNGSTDNQNFQKGENTEGQMVQIHLMQASNSRRGYPYSEIIEIKSPQKNEDIPLLKNINLEIKKGHHYAIFGNSGSGKTNLISCMIGEMINIKGSVSINQTAKINYIPQKPFIFKDSIKSNIIKDNEYDSNKYKRIISACKLTELIDSLAKGDETKIGFGEIKLTKIQEQKISLARSAYNLENSNFILIDDVFSDFPEEIALQIYEEVIENLFRNHSIILVCMQLDKLALFHKIIFIENGSILGVDSYDLLSLNSDNFRKLIVKNRDEVMEENYKFDFNENEKCIDEIPQTASKNIKRRVFQDNNIENDAVVDILQKEKKEIFEISAQKLLKIIRSGKLIFAIIVFIISSFYVILKLYLFYWLGIWGFSSDKSRISFFLGIYFALGGPMILLEIILQFFLMVFVFKLGFISHLSFIERLLKAPLKWHKSNPIRFIYKVHNEFQKIIDKELVPMFVYILFEILTIIFGLIVIAIIFPWLIFVIIVGICLYILAFIWSHKCFTDLANAYYNSKTPILNAFRDILEGLTYIRVNNYSKVIIDQFISNLKNNSNINFMKYKWMRWISLRSDLVIAFLIIPVPFFVILNKDSRPSYGLGLVLVQTIQIMEAASSLLIHYVKFQRKIRSFVRYFENIDHIPQEGSFETPKCLIEGWPKYGKIDISNLNIPYLNSKPEDQNFTFTIKSFENLAFINQYKIGKSILYSIMRIIEPFSYVNISGERIIFIDEEDVCKIGIHELRKHIIFIPANARLIIGSLKINIDPFNIFNKDSMMQALIKTGLADRIHGLICKQKNISINQFNQGIIGEGKNNNEDEFQSNILEYPIMTTDSTLSLQDRFLVYFSKAILKKPKILLIDWSEQKKDFSFESLINNLILNEFKQTTVIINCKTHIKPLVKEFDNIYLLDQKVYDDKKLVIVEEVEEEKKNENYFSLKNAVTPFAKISEVESIKEDSIEI